MSLSARDIATVLGVNLQVLEINWPLVQNALQERAIRSDLVEVAVAGTIHVETAATWRPIHEFGGRDPEAYFTKHYEKRRDLGNVQPGDGARFHGRGFVQITGRANYRKMGRALNLPLEDQPDLALEPGVSARILAQFVFVRHIDMAANARDWDRVRVRVNGGTNNLADFRAAVGKLLAVLHG